MGIVKETKNMIIDATRQIGITNQKNFIKKGEFLKRKFKYKTIQFSESGLLKLIRKKNGDELKFKGTLFNVGLVTSALTIIRGFQMARRIDDCDFDVCYVRAIKYKYPLVFIDIDLVVMIPPAETWENTNDGNS
jgi:hypothetical protein